MSQRYILAVSRLRWLLGPLEHHLEGVKSVSVGEISKLSRRTPSKEDVAAAVGALESIGLLRSTSEGYVVNATVRDGTREYRRGVHETAETLSGDGGASPPETQLCAAVPRGLDAAARDSIHVNAVDLRSGLLDIVATARERVVLASPFWDSGTTSELSHLIARRAKAGVRVDVIGRRASAVQGWGALLEEVSDCPHCRFWIWEQVDNLDSFGMRTFHFKTAVSDHGSRAYLGSANFTQAGLRSRLELGVLFHGGLATQISRVVDVVLQTATPYAPAR